MHIEIVPTTTDLPLSAVRNQPSLGEFYLYFITSAVYIFTVSPSLLFLCLLTFCDLNFYGLHKENSSSPNEITTTYNTVQIKHLASEVMFQKNKSCC